MLSLCLVWLLSTPAGLLAHADLQVCDALARLRFVKRRRPFTKGGASPLSLRFRLCRSIPPGRPRTISTNPVCPVPETFLYALPQAGAMKTVVAALGLLLLGACGPGLPSPEELLTRIVEADDQLQTYVLESSDRMAMAAEISGQSLKLATAETSRAEFDRIGRRLHRVGAGNSSMGSGSQPFNSELFVVGDVAYSQSGSGGQWMRTEFSPQLWAQHDKLAQARALLQAGRITGVKPQALDGVPVFAVTVEVEPRQFLAMSLSGAEAKSQDTLELAKSIKEAHFAVWVNRKTFLVERTVSDLKIVLEPDPVQSQEAAGRVETDIHSEARRKEANTPLAIVLPPDAMNVLPMPGVGAPAPASDGQRPPS